MDCPYTSLVIPATSHCYLRQLPHTSYLTPVTLHCYLRLLPHTATSHIPTKTSLATPHSTEVCQLAPTSTPGDRVLAQGSLSLHTTFASVISLIVLGHHSLKLGHVCLDTPHTIYTLNTHYIPCATHTLHTLHTDYTPYMHTIHPTYNAHLTHTLHNSS